MQPSLSLLLRDLDRAFVGPAWHGPTLWGSLKKVTPEVAAWRPGPERNNVWELAVHAAYWKYRVYRRVTGEPPRSFGIPGSNFFPRPAGAQGDAAQELWKADLQRLQDWHRHLKRAGAALDPNRLQERPGSSRFTIEQLLSGATAHDLYHAGQIQLIKRLQSS